MLRGRQSRQQVWVEISHTLLQIVEREVAEMGGVFWQCQEPSRKCIPEEPRAGHLMEYPILDDLSKEESCCHQPRTTKAPGGGGGRVTGLVRSVFLSHVCQMSPVFRFWSPQCCCFLYRGNKIKPECGSPPPPQLATVPHGKFSLIRRRVTLTIQDILTLRTSCDKCNNLESVSP